MVQDNIQKKIIKTSYTIPCSSDFRDKINALADEKEMNVGDLARSVLLLFPWEMIENYEDPGNPDREDREEVWIKTGAFAGKCRPRKPRLQMRLMKGVGLKMVRRALQIFYDIEHKNVLVSLRDPSFQQSPLELEKSSEGAIRDIQEAFDQGFVKKPGRNIGDDIRTKAKQSDADDALTSQQKAFLEIYSQGDRSLETEQDARAILGIGVLETLTKEKVFHHKKMIETLYKDLPFDKKTNLIEGYLQKVSMASGFLLHALDF